MASDKNQRGVDLCRNCDQNGEELERGLCGQCAHAYKLALRESAAKRYPRLTLRLLDAMGTALDQMTAGSPDMIEGFRDDEAEKIFEAMQDARTWVSAEIERRKPNGEGL